MRSPKGKAWKKPSRGDSYRQESGWSSPMSGLRKGSSPKEREPYQVDDREASKHGSKRESREKRHRPGLRSPRMSASPRDSSPNSIKEGTSSRYESWSAPMQKSKREVRPSRLSASPRDSLSPSSLQGTSSRYESWSTPLQSKKKELRASRLSTSSRGMSLCSMQPGSKKEGREHSKHAGRFSLSSVPKSSQRKQKSPSLATSSPSPTRSEKKRRRSIPHEKIDYDRNRYKRRKFEEKRSAEMKQLFTKSKKGYRSGATTELTLFCNQRKRDFEFDENSWSKYTEGGLGYRKIRVRKESTGEQLHEEILQAFPALEEANGFAICGRDSKSTKLTPRFTGTPSLVELKARMGRCKMIFIVPLQGDLELRKPKAKYVKCRECDKMILQEEFIEHLLEHDAWKDVLDVQSDSSENYSPKFESSKKGGFKSYGNRKYCGLDKGDINSSSTTFESCEEGEKSSWAKSLSPFQFSPPSSTAPLMKADLPKSREKTGEETNTSGFPSFSSSRQSDEKKSATFSSGFQSQPSPIATFETAGTSGWNHFGGNLLSPEGPSTSYPEGTNNEVDFDWLAL